MSYESTATLPQIADALRAASSVVVTTHAKPDGDALGSLLALAAALESLGKDVQRWVMPPVPRSLKFLTEGVQMHAHGGPEDPLPSPEPDAIVIVDTGAWTQLEPMRPWLEPRAERTIVLDHHLMGATFAPLRHIDPQAAAAAEVVAELIDVLGCEYDAPICRSLYVALATDTGWFRFSNTRPRTHELAARLLRGGVDHASLFSRLEQSERVQKLALMIRAMDSLQLVAGGAAAIMTLRHDDFLAVGAGIQDTERLVDLPQIVEEVRVVVLISEEKDGRLRMSFRSKPGADPVDVSELARNFDGGGHARAAGAKVRGEEVDALKSRVVDVLEAALAKPIVKS